MIFSGNVPAAVAGTTSYLEEKALSPGDKIMVESKQVKWGC